MSKIRYEHRVAKAGAIISHKDFHTEKGISKEFLKKVRLLKVFAKAIDLELWVDEHIVDIKQK